ncbi:ribonuclease H-like domain-containing protein [Halorussus ruber]|uniref:ribonuclease H-like domain-containing protein n=1 Tax=Halorussus ruber TaxID=1126238 RepID=UPI00109288A7|nr:ribonuclease H-like domain-containing protein [Halorussus ruber]
MIGLTVLPEVTMQRCQGQQLQDIVRYFDSDIIFTPSQVHEPFLKQQIGNSVEVMTQPLQLGRPLELIENNGVRLVWISTPTDLKKVIANKQKHREYGCSDTYLLSDLLAVSIDLVNLDANLEGLEQYRTPLVENDALGEFTHLTIEANPDYRAEWHGVDVQGVMPGANEQQGTTHTSVAHFELQADGIVGGKTRKLSKFGLRAVDQVGESRAETLNKAGIESRQGLSTASVHEISNLSGLGQSTAQTMIESAQVIEQGEIRKAPNASLPDGDPIFIDIETDGLNPTIVWLIGVLLPGEEGRYMPFIETDPSQPEVALEAFLSWLAEFGRGRPVVAYNGWNFDFPVINEHIADYCPRYLDLWENTYRFDLYDWAVNKNNATLPGLTNKLDDVAQALGWEPLDTGLTGAEVARLFQRYAENPCPATELDWERHKKYCEDDVRALAHIYNRIKESTNRMTTSGSSRSSMADSTSQGTLSDF